MVDKMGMGAALKTPPSQAVVQEMTALFKGLPLFENFPVNLLTELAAASERVELPVNTQILKQGQLNEHLYFLLEGQVGVYVDGGRVSLLHSRGDLLGEMSVITHHPVGATLLTESAVSLLRVNARDFERKHDKDKDLYLSILYRIYATVLARKLTATNEKAKYFEELNQKLSATQADLEEINQSLEKKVEERTQRLEQQNAVLMASNSKMEEMFNNKRILFQRLNLFNEQNLAPLKGFLDDVRKLHPEEETIRNARRIVFDVQQVLGPLIAQYSLENAMLSKRVLLADSNKKQQVIAKMALGGSGVDLDMASSLEEGTAKINENTYDLLFVDHAMVDLGNLARQRNPHIGVVLMTSAAIPDYLPALQHFSATPNIVSRDESDRTFTVKNIMTTVTKLLSRDVFGLEKYLSWGVEIRSRQIVSSRQRAELIAEVDSYFAELGIRRGVRDRIRTVLEEMLMNAIYDAPAADGHSLYNHMPRTEELSLKAEEQGLLRFATDGMFVAVSVQDPFGGLNGATLLRYLEKNYAGADTAALHGPERKGGAGRGLHQIVEGSDLVVFNVEPGKRTEVIALFNVEVKETANKTPSFHLFFKS